MSRGFYSVAALGVALGLAAGAHAQTWYSNDFSSPPTSASGVFVTSIPRGGAIENVGTGIAGFYSGGVFRNATGGNGQDGTISTWTFAGLGAHTQLTVDFTLAFLDSWDSNNGSPGPDILRIYLDGTPVLDLTTNAASGSNQILGGGTLVALGDYFNTMGGPYYSHDAIVDMSTAPALTFAHSGSTFTLGIQALSPGGSGWQGGSDESWGIDNLTLSSAQKITSGVPEPATWAMMIMGFALVGASVRARRLA